MTTLTAAQNPVGSHAARVRAFLKRFDPITANFAGVEVGVFRGDGTVSLLNAFPHLILFGVDQWAATPEYVATGDPTAAYVDDGCYLGVLDRLRLLGLRDRGRIVRAASLSVAEWLPDASLDFVFLDGDHSFAGVAADLTAWWPKVRPGGWLCGHDYGNSSGRDHIAGVVPAVDGWARELGLAVEAEGEAGDWTWWVRKPGAI